MSAPRGSPSGSTVAASARSPVGSPTRSLLSRLHTGESPSTATRSSAAQQLGTRNTGHGVEHAGENAPYTFVLGARDVTLADKFLQDEGCSRVVSELIGRGKDLGVVSLDLRGNDIRRYGAEAIGELLRENSSVESLNLEWNFLGDSGGSGLDALCDALKTNRTLSSLDLRNNRLNSECGVSLARLLIVNRTLSNLDLRWNNLGALGGAAIADALVRNHHIRHILLSGNRIPAQTVRAIEEALAKNREVNLLAARGDPAKKLDDEARLLAAEQQVHDLQRELTRVQTAAARTEQELADERRRCDELTDSLASLRDKGSAAKALAQKNYSLLQLDVERAQAELFECQRRADADAQTLKAQSAELLRAQSELRVVTEDRARLLLAREQSTSLLNTQIEQQHAEWARLNESLHAKERAWAEERSGFEAKRAHDRRMADSERELALTAAIERQRALQLELAREKEEHASQLADLGARLKALQESSGDSNSTVLALREQLVQQALTHEEALAKLESSHRSESTQAHKKTLASMEERLSALQSVRDELARSNEAQKQQYDQLLAQLTRERNEHLASLEKERLSRNDQANNAAAVAAENYSLKARLMEHEHRASLVASQIDSHNQALAEQSKRNQDQIAEIYSKARLDARQLEKTLRAEQDEKNRLIARVKQLESQLASAEAEQMLRSQNLASALSALKSSVNVVDASVQQQQSHQTHSHTHRETTGSLPSSPSHASRHHHHSSSGTSSRHHHHSSHRDRDRDRDREHGSSSSRRDAVGSSSAQHSHRSSSDRHHHHSSGDRHHHHHSSSSRRASESLAPGSAAGSANNSGGETSAPAHTHSTPSRTSGPAQLVVTPLPLSSLPRSTHASPKAQTQPQHIQQRRVQTREDEDDDPAEQTAEASISYEDSARAAQQRQMQRRGAPPAQTAAVAVEDDEPEISFDEDQ